MALISFKIIMAIFALAAANEQDTLWQVHPVSVAIRNEVVGLEDENCIPLTSPDVSSASSVEFVHCHHPTRITDSDKSQPTFTQDTHNSVYIWPSRPDQVLFTFSSRKLINSITLHYYSNEDNQGLPKLRFFAVPEDFKVTNRPSSSYPTRVLDAVFPGDESTGLRNKTRDVPFNTTKILMTKGFTKNYQFYLSEIEFFTSDAESLDEVPTTESPTTVPTTQATTTTATATTGTAASTQTTVETTTEAATEEETMTILSSNGVKVETATLSGDGRMHSQVNSLHLIALTLLLALTMLR